MTKIVKEHEMVRKLTEIVITPDHVERKESETFRKAKERLKKDGHYKCWICGGTEDLQVHHFGCEWSLEADCDFNKLKELLMLFDIYGYSHSMKDEPISTVDDIRNQMVICQHHHTHPETGIHEVTFPIWILQKVCKAGEDPVPDNADTVDDAYTESLGLAPEENEKENKEA